ncbi:MAG: winged helix-turn-helix domain-containing protein [Acidimicrobiia bacterium]|jgi:DNA-binding transcriptional ArsR family regulator
MADHKAPGYELDETLHMETIDQYRALFEETRQQIVDLLLERAANIKELAETLDKPKGTIGHHVSVLEDAGLIRVVRTEKIRAIESKYYGRTARTYVIGDAPDSSVDMAPGHFLATAAAEYAAGGTDKHDRSLSTLRYARIPDDRADEWNTRLTELAAEFTTEKRGGETTYGLMIALYPTDRPHLPDEETGE